MPTPQGQPSHEAALRKSAGGPDQPVGPLTLGRKAPSRQVLRGDQMAKKIDGYINLQVPARAGQSLAADRTRARSARRQHHGVLQVVQRQDEGHGAGHADPGEDHGLLRPLVHVRDADAAGVASSSRRRRRSPSGSQGDRPRRRRHRDDGAGARDREAEDEGSQHRRRRGGRARRSPAPPVRWACR